MYSVWWPLFISVIGSCGAHVTVSDIHKLFEEINWPIRLIQPISFIQFIDSIDCLANIIGLIHCVSSQEEFYIGVLQADRFSTVHNNSKIFFTFCHIIFAMRAPLPLFDVSGAHLWIVMKCFIESKEMQHKLHNTLHRLILLRNSVAVKKWETTKCCRNILKLFMCFLWCFFSFYSFRVLNIDYLCLNKEVLKTLIFSMRIFFQRRLCCFILKGACIS